MMGKKFTSREAIPIAHAMGYAGYNKVVNCHCNRPDFYGAMRVPDLQAALEGKAQAVPEKRKDNARVSFWCGKGLREKIEVTAKARGYATIKAYMVALAVADVLALEKESAAEAAGTALDGKETNT